MRQEVGFDQALDVRNLALVQWGGALDRVQHHVISLRQFVQRIRRLELESNDLAQVEAIGSSLDAHLNQDEIAEGGYFGGHSCGAGESVLQADHPAFAIIVPPSDNVFVVADQIMI